MTKPITTFTRAIQPPLRGMRFRYEGKTASRKNGRARPGAKVTMPLHGRGLSPATDAASKVPTKGPTQAKEASENVSPMSRLPRKPPWSADRFRRVRITEGMVISKAPSRLNPKAMKRAEMNALTHGLLPRVTMPNGPRMAVVRTGPGIKEDSISFTPFLAKVKAGEVKEVTIADRDVHGVYQNPNLGFHTQVPANYPPLYDLLNDKTVNVNIKDTSSGGWVSILLNASPFIVLLAFWIFRS